MSNANNFLQNLGMMQPMFAAANPQQQSGDDAIDLHDIFADYFNEDPTGAQLSGAFAAALPTGAGIRTAWHAGSLPAMQQQQQQQQQQGAGTEPAAKRARGEDLYLPGQQQQAYGANTGVTQQQQMALAQAASGVGALSNRLGFNVQSNTSAGQVMGQQQSQGVMPTQQQAAAAAGMVNLPVGMGMKFGAGGNIVPPAGAPGVANGVGGGIKTGLVNNVASMPQQQLASRVAVSNTQYGISPGMGLMTKANVEDQMAAERRLRNREHAKRSRVRKKFMVESLQQQVRGLQDENSTLRLLVQKHIPQNALQIIDECCSKSVLFATGDTANNAAAKAPQDASKKGAETPLLRSDFSLIESLTSGQQNFVLSDPRLPDNPIVFASPGFFELTGYTREQVLGRNCRFLQGAGTDRKSIDVIRTAVANGTDATVCLLNYKADGTPFWNQLFVAALRDADNCIVNYVGVQTMIEPNAGATALEDKVNAAHPITVGVEDEGKGGKE
ncbi:hypothetical protein ACHAXT_007869 [Thalassiosira profunda]